jgi:hypothetical protein
VTCDESGFRRYASECQERWDGAFVMQDSWEPKHPGDYPIPVIRPARVTIARKPEVSLSRLNPQEDQSTGNWYGNGEIN